MTRKRAKKTSQSRKSPSRSTRRKNGKVIKGSAHFLFRETLAVIVTAASCFFLFALASLKPIAVKLCGISVIGSMFPCSYSENLMGPAGQFASELLFGLFGYAGITVALFLMIMAFVLWQHTDEEKPIIETTLLTQVLSALAAIVLLSGLCAVVWGPLDGGMFGGVLNSIVPPLFGKFGSLLILLFAAAVAVRFAVGMYLKSLAIGAGKLIGSGAILFSSAFKWLALQGGSALGFLSQGLITAALALFRFIGITLRGVVRLALGRPFRRRQDRYQATSFELEDEELSLEGPIEPKGKRGWKKNREDKVVVVKHSLPSDAPSRKSKSSEFSTSTDTERYKDYQPPTYDLLEKAQVSDSFVEKEETLFERSRAIEEKLEDFSVQGKVTHVHPGPVITMYEFVPAPGVKLGKIVGLQDDLAMALKAPSVRIVAPLPDRGTVGIEIPNDHREIVRLQELLMGEELSKSRSSLAVPIGKDTFGRPVNADIASMPHLLMAGATGTGKSVCINALLLSLLYRSHPNDLQFIMIDPKILELSVYEGIPHLKVPVVSDPRKAKAVLQWAVIEMDSRYRLLKDYGVRSIDAYNEIASGEGHEGRARVKEVSRDMEEGSETKIIAETLPRLPKIVIVIDELADLMLMSGREVEELITRLAQKARAAGIHLILATQRPSVDVITGLIKANFPARISFRVSSRIDSRTILDSIGSERLLGRGDMLFLEPGAHHLKRVHGAFVADSEVRAVTQYLRESCTPQYDEEILEMCERALEDSGASLEPSDEENVDPLYDKALQFVLEKGQASTSMIQRMFRIGYNRAARIVDMMEREGVVGPMDGSRPRPVITPHASNEE